MRRHDRRGRSGYTFEINCDIKLIENLLEGYLMAYNFKRIDEQNEHYYRTRSLLKQGYKCIQFEILGRNLKVVAWYQEKKYNHYYNYTIEQQEYRIHPYLYKKELKKLFEEIEKINNKEKTQNSVEECTKVFKQEIIKRKEIMCEIGFWISLVQIILSFFEMYNILITIGQVYLILQGIGTKKRIKTILGITFSAILIILMAMEIKSTYF